MEEKSEDYTRGAPKAEKLMGPRFGSQHRPEAGLGVGAGGGRPLPLWGSGVLPPKFF